MRTGTTFSIIGLMTTGRHPSNTRNLITPLGLSIVAAWSFLLVAGLSAVQPAQAQQMVMDHEKVLEEAGKRNWPIHAKTPDGRGLGLRAIYNGMPMYYITDNAVAARSTSTFPLYPGGAAGLSLTGAGVLLGVWDESGVLLNHVEFGDRATQIDIPLFLSRHATHVAGTMAAAGVHRPARGMSYEANLICFDWNQDLVEMDSAAKNLDLRVSNHSYGLITGWTIGFVDECDVCVNEPLPDPDFPIAWFWYGDVSVSPFEDYFFGYYSVFSRAWDAVSDDNERYLIVKSAGNARNFGPQPGTWHYYFDPTGTPQVQGCPPPDGLGCWRFSTDARSVNGINGFDCISHTATAKNGLVVGAVNDVPNGYQGPASVVMSSFSSWGPTDDGRIKPDIVGNGVQLLSTIESFQEAYGSSSGTSMASPNVSGSIGLLIQHWRNTHPGMDDMLSSTMRGLVIHTADECGSAPGPDYSFGWGLMNTRRAAELITLDQTMPLTISEHVLGQGQMIELFLVSDPAHSELRATLCWLDPPPVSLPPVALNPRNPMLVNDLDLRLIGPTQTHMPWVLDVENPSFPATRGDNVVDNVEQVVIPTTVSNAYRLRVTHKGVLTGGSQKFSLIISGAKSIRSEPESIAPTIAEATPTFGAPVGAFTNVRVVFDEPVFGVAPGQLQVNGVPATIVGGSGAGPYLFSGFTQPLDGPVAIQLVGGAIQDMFGNAFVGAGWSYLKADCNGNGVFDAQDIASGDSSDCNKNGIPDECDPDVLRLLRSNDEVVEFSEVRSAGASAFIAGGVSPLSIKWTFKTDNGGENFDGNVPGFVPSEPGVYDVRLIASDAVGCEVAGFYKVNVTQADIDALGFPFFGGFFCPFMGALSVAVTLVGVFGMRLRRRKAAHRMHG